MNIGIDLGTFNSAAAVVLGRGEVVMVESKMGLSQYGKSFPSFVSFSHEGEKQQVGINAKNARVHNPKLVIWGVKRLVGLSYEKAMRDSQFKRFSYDIESGTDGGILIKVGGKRFSPSHILEYILREIKEDAQNTQFNPRLGGEVEQAIISVPAYFDGTRVGAIMEAAKNAGLGEIKTITEPTAAALAYIHSSKNNSQLKLKSETKILVFDLGAGTLDVTVMLILFEAGKLNPGELLTSGNEALGGIDMDAMLMSHLIQKYELSGIENDPRLNNILMEAVEEVKIALSKRRTRELLLPNNKEVELTREELDEALKPVLEECRGPISQALRDSGLKASDLDHVLFVGGPTYMPCVRATVMDELQTLGASKELLEELANWQHEESPVNPMECVARGAALKAGGILKPTTTSNPYGYGVITYGDLFYPIIPVNSYCPITMATTIVYPDPELRRVTIPLARKRAQDKAGRTVYEYEHLGDYDYYTNPTGEDPEISITMTLDKNGALITTSEHRQRRESIKFEKLNMHTGTNKDLVEYSEEARIQREEEARIQREGERKASSPPRPWTREELEKAMRVARMIVDEFADRCTDVKVTQKKKELLDLLEGPLDPQRQTPSVMNRMLELLNALSNAGVIKVDDFFHYMKELSKIERG